jgi:hypothetical protein
MAWMFFPQMMWIREGAYRLPLSLAVTLFERMSQIEEGQGIKVPFGYG